MNDIQVFAFHMTIRRKMAMKELLEKLSATYNWNKIERYRQDGKYTYMDSNDVIIHINTETNMFKLEYFIPHSIMRVTTGQCGNFTDEKYFMDVYNQIRNQKMC